METSHISTPRVFPRATSSRAWEPATTATTFFIGGAAGRYLAHVCSGRLHDPSVSWRAPSRLWTQASADRQLASQVSWSLLQGVLEGVMAGTLVQGPLMQGGSVGLRLDRRGCAQRLFCGPICSAFLSAFLLVAPGLQTLLCVQACRASLRGGCSRARSRARFCTPPTSSAQSLAPCSPPSPRTQPTIIAPP